MAFFNTIRLFWWNERIMQGKSKENYGDILGQYLVEKISGKKAIFAWPKKFSVLDFFSPVYVTIGSILTNVNHKCIVWGSGIISRDYPVKKAVFLAVRGPQTRKFLMESGYEVPEIYGDPAILLPQYFNPKIEKKYRYGVVPHYNDYELAKKMFLGDPGIRIIDMMTNDVEQKTIEFLECERIISSSLHGIIIAHAYQIPAVWQKFSDKVFGDDIKYRDYMESVGLEFYRPEIRNSFFTRPEMDQLFEDHPDLPSKEILENLRARLMEACPFKKY